MLSKICANKYRLSFLKAWLGSKVCPDILSNFRIARLQPGHKIEAIFIQNSLGKLTNQLIKFRKLYYRLRSQFLTVPSFYDRLWFERYLSRVIESNRTRLLSSNDKKVKYLIFKKYSCISYPNVIKVVLNLSSVEISNLQLTILAHGLDHCIPSSIVKWEEIFSEFEVLFAQLRRLQPVSREIQLVT